jgi:hypothetical protein
MLEAVLFEQRFWAGIADGSITMTFRRWKRRQVVAGRPYRTPAAIVAVEAVDIVDEAAISDDDARRAGYPAAADLLADLRGTPDLPIYRVRFHPVAGPDPRAELAADAQLTETDLAELDRRLDRLDRASSYGLWTAATLAAIAAYPGRRAADLATAFGREVQPFKTDVRKLKNLGLTISLEVGYRLSPRGAAYLQRSHRAAGKFPPMNESTETGTIAAAGT